MHVGTCIPFMNHARVDDHELVKGELALGDLAEPLGFDSLWCFEHHFTSYMLSPNPLQILTYFAGRTKRIQLGTMVVVLPWHHPGAGRRGDAAARPFLARPDTAGRGARDRQDRVRAAGRGSGREQGAVDRAHPLPDVDARERHLRVRRRARPPAEGAASAAARSSRSATASSSAPDRPRRRRCAPSSASACSSSRRRRPRRTSRTSTAYRDAYERIGADGSGADLPGHVLRGRGSRPRARRRPPSVRPPLRRDHRPLRVPRDPLRERQEQQGLRRAAEADLDARRREGLEGPDVPDESRWARRSRCATRSSTSARCSAPTTSWAALATARCRWPRPSAISACSPRRCCPISSPNDRSTRGAAHASRLRCDVPESRTRAHGSRGLPRGDPARASRRAARLRLGVELPSTT